MYSLIMWSLAYWLFLQPRSIDKQVPAHGADVSPATRPFNTRLADAIRESLHDAVVLEDVLGEGANAWDADPRYPAATPRATVNCMIWLQKVLATTYAQNDADRAVAMDRIRYFHGSVSFGARKHYTEHFLDLDPMPFRAVGADFCKRPNTVDVQLDPDIFRRAKRYECPLFQQDKRDFKVLFWKPNDLDECFVRKAGRYFVLFAVPMKKYREKYLQQSGPMGLVHAMILKAGDKPQTSVVYHASTSAAHVLVEQASSFFEKMKDLHRGYAVYELDETWKPSELLPGVVSEEVRKELDEIKNCEQRLAK